MRGFSFALREDLAPHGVGAFEQVFGGYAFGIAPGLVSWIMRKAGGDEVTGRIIEAQRNWR